MWRVSPAAAIGCRPAAERSMMERRRWPRPTRTSAYPPTPDFPVVFSHAVLARDAVRRLEVVEEIEPQLPIEVEDAGLYPQRGVAAGDGKINQRIPADPRHFAQRRVEIRLGKVLQHVGGDDDVELAGREPAEIVHAAEMIGGEGCIDVECLDRVASPPENGQDQAPSGSDHDDAPTIWQRGDVS